MICNYSRWTGCHPRTEPSIWNSPDPNQVESEGPERQGKTTSTLFELPRDSVRLDCRCSRSRLRSDSTTSPPRQLPISACPVHSDSIERCRRVGDDLENGILQIHKDGPEPLYGICSFADFVSSRENKKLWQTDDCGSTYMPRPSSVLVPSLLWVTKSCQKRMKTARIRVSLGSRLNTSGNLILVDVLSSSRC